MLVQSVALHEASATRPSGDPSLWSRAARPAQRVREAVSILHLQSSNNNGASGLMNQDREPLQNLVSLRARRFSALALNLCLYAGLTIWLASILGAGGWSAIDAGFMLCFLIAAPWNVLGAVNAGLGFWLARRGAAGVAAAAPFLDAIEESGPVTLRVALVMTIRNEDAKNAIERLASMAHDLDRSGAPVFANHILSDTSDERIALQEKACVADWCARDPALAARIFYRRRAENAGFKAGNLRDFCKSHVNDYDAMIVLDADSTMSGSTILNMLRVAQKYPQIGILQSLVVGAPSASAFARIFQFGMRHGMRSYTLGSAYWTADCGPFWGHNALVRIRPFLDHCALPILPGKPPFGGPILSHDQLESALMRRAGFEARVMPMESGSAEDNPPTLAEFSQRDMRWCQGNLQYGRPLLWPRLLPLSRFQIAWALLMFIAQPAGQLMIVLAGLKAFDSESAAIFPVASAMAFYAAYLLLALAPKLAGLADVVLTRGALARYGGALRFASGLILEIIFSFLMSAIVSFRTSFFLFGMWFGKERGWGAQSRSAHAVSWGAAARDFWPPTLFGILILSLISTGAPAALPWALPYVGGCVIAIPFAIITASPRLGLWLQKHKICGVPEEFSPQP